jgi:hypothetical protein
MCFVFYLAVTADSLRLQVEQETSEIWTVEDIPQTSPQQELNFKQRKKLIKYSPAIIIGG